MKCDNKCCSVCKYRFKVRPLGYIEFVPPNIDVYVYNTFNQALLEYVVNLAFYVQAMMIIPDVWHRGTYYDHAIYQGAYLLTYYLFSYFRYFSLIKNKELYYKLFDSEAKNLLGLQLAAVVGLPFVHNPIYHFSAVFLATYIRNPVLYYHYRTLRVINQTIDYRFLEAEPTSSS
jgi:hypothetical protein